MFTREGYNTQELLEIAKVSMEPVLMENEDQHLKILLIGPHIHFAITDVFFGYLDGLKALDIDCDGIGTHQLKAFVSEDVLGKYIHSICLDPRKGYTHIGFIGGLVEAKWWILDSIRTMGKKSFVIATEDPHQLDQNEALYRSVDYYFSNELEVKDVFEGSFYLPTAGSVNFTRRFTKEEIAEIDVEHLKCDLLHLGTIYDNRIEFLKEIAPMVREHKLKMIITGIGETDTLLPPELKEFFLPISKASSNIKDERGTTINHGDVSLLYNLAKIVINVNRESLGHDHNHSSNKKYLVHGTSLNPRCYEVPMCGSIVAIDKKRMEYEKIFKTEGENQQIIAFENGDDFIRQALPIIRNEELRQNIIENVHEYTCKYHSYYNRATRLMKFIHAKEGRREQAAELLLEKGFGINNPNIKVKKKS